MSDQEITAMHEAAHAVVAIYLGLRVDRITIGTTDYAVERVDRLSDDDDLVGYTDVTHTGRHTDARVATAAGEAAESAAGIPPADIRENCARDRASAACSDRVWNSARDRAQMILSRPDVTAAVAALTGALLTMGTGTMTGDMVHQIVRRRLISDPFTAAHTGGH